MKLIAHEHTLPNIGDKVIFNTYWKQFNNGVEGTIVKILPIFEKNAGTVRCYLIKPKKPWIDRIGQQHKLVCCTREYFQIPLENTATYQLDQFLSEVKKIPFLNVKPENHIKRYMDQFMIYKVDKNRIDFFIYHYIHFCTTS
jgi:hypothetical protein